MSVFDKAVEVPKLLEHLKRGIVDGIHKIRIESTETDATGKLRMVKLEIAPADEYKCANCGKELAEHMRSHTVYLCPTSMFREKNKW